MADPRPKRRRLLVALLLPLGLLITAGALLPTLLSTAPLREVVRASLARRVGTPLAFDSIDLSWSGPTTVRGISVGGRGRFAEETLLHAGAVTVAASFPALLSGGVPADLELEDAEVRVTRDSIGAVDWAVSFGESFAGVEDLRLRLRRGTVRVEDRTNGTISWLRDVELELDPARRRFSLDATSETPAGRGAVLARWTPRDDGAIAAEGVARGLDLGWYEPLLAAFVDGGELAGRVDLDLNAVIGPGARIDGTANGALKGIRVLAPRVTGALPILATLVTCEGGLGADLERGVVSFDAFHLASSMVELEGNGLLALEDGGWTGDAVVRFNADCARAVRRIRPLLVGWVPFRNVTGSIDVRLRPRGEVPTRRFDLAVTAEQFAIQPSETLHLPIGTSALFADVAFDPRAGRVSLRDLRTEARFGDLTGHVDLTWPSGARPLALDADLSLTSETRDLASFLHVVLPGIPLLMAGPVEARLRTRIDAAERTARFEVASDWFDVNVDHDRGGGRIDTYNFFGKPFEAALDLEAPVGADDLLATAAGRLVVDAPGCSIYRNELEDLDLEVTIAGGTATVDRATARGFGGTVSGTGALTFAGAPPLLRAELEADGLKIEDRFPAWFAACVAPVFAARPGPFAVENDLRLEGRLAVEADGRRLHEWLRTLRGEGRARMVGTEVDGSPLLQALVEPYGEPGPRRVDAIETTLSIEDGRIFSTPTIRLGDGNELTLRGEANGLGELRYQVSAESIFGSAFVQAHRMVLAPDLFRVEGRFDRPEFVLPNPGTWRRLASEGRLEEEIRKMRNP